LREAGVDDFGSLGTGGAGDGEEGRLLFRKAGVRVATFVASQYVPGRPLSAPHLYISDFPGPREEARVLIPTVEARCWAAETWSMAVDITGDVGRSTTRRAGPAWRRGSTRWKARNAGGTHGPGRGRLLSEAGGAARAWRSGVMENWVRYASRVGWDALAIRPGRTSAAIQMVGGRFFVDRSAALVRPNPDTSRGRPGGPTVAGGGGRGLARPSGGPILATGLSLPLVGGEVGGRWPPFFRRAVFVETGAGFRGEMRQGVR